MNRVKSGKIWAIFVAFCLTGFTAYVLLDAFVIPRSYQVVYADTSVADVQNNTSGTETTASSGTTELIAATAEEGSAGTSESTVDDSADTSVDSAADTSAETTDESGVAASSDEVVITENSYSDGNVTITITQYREYDTDIYVADIVVSDISYLQTAFAESTYGKNVTETTSEIAAEVDAILAINGDFYGTRNYGYVIRNGVLYRSDAASSDQEDLVIYEDGTFDIIQEGDITAEELLENGAVQVLSFGPGLIENGEISVSQTEEVGKAMTSNPRTAIGMIDPLHYVMVVSDGRTSESEGLSLYELATFMQDELGTTIAYNLDGGGSSTMVFNNTVINNPTTSGKTIKERSVSDIVYIW